VRGTTTANKVRGEKEMSSLSHESIPEGGKKQLSAYIYTGRMVQRKTTTKLTSLWKELRKYCLEVILVDEARGALLLAN
jgi:hypothetical protein